jgi:hypothetical protein
MTPVVRRRILRAGCHGFNNATLTIVDLGHFSGEIIEKRLTGHKIVPIAVQAVFRTIIQPVCQITRRTAPG